MFGTVIDNIDVSVQVYDKMEKKKINWKATKGRESWFFFVLLRFKNPATYITYYYCYNNSGDRLGFEGWQRKSDKNDIAGEWMGRGVVGGGEWGCYGGRIEGMEGMKKEE